jgi:phenylpyruvate tautomerase PptA (4-oxalocrotonate tautomerase family)
MPFYEIYHSTPLTLDQRQALATKITDLHCTKFTTPSFFVHVRFIPQDASDGTYFMGGKPRTACSNRIIGILRVSPKRTKSDFDSLSEMIEKAWYNVVKGSIQDTEKRIMMVTFTQMITIREGGMAIPEAGQEDVWFKEQMDYFREMDGKGLEDFGDLLKELQEREDLKKLTQ